MIIESRPASRDKSRAGNSRSRSRYRQHMKSGYNTRDQTPVGHQHTQSSIDGMGSRSSPGPTKRWSEHGNTHNQAPKSFPSASLPYAPPEILSAPPSGPSLAQDIWALGVILHALLTSRLPFRDTFDPRLQMKILRGDWVVPTHLGREWVECLLGCLDGDKHRRLTIEELANSDAVQGWTSVTSRSRSRSRARSSSRKPDDRQPALGLSPGSRSTARGRELRHPDRDGSADAFGSNTTSRNPSRGASIPRRPRTAYDTPPTAGHTHGHGLSKVLEAGDELTSSMKKLEAGSRRDGRSRSRGRGEGVGSFDLPHKPDGTNRR